MYHNISPVTLIQNFKQDNMFPNSALSIAVAVSLLNNFSVQATSLAGTKTKLKALQTLVLNNAQATVRLDSSALKQLLKLSSYGKSS